MNLINAPKIDSHLHVFDPLKFPYSPGTFYAPSGSEIGTPDQFLKVMDCHNVKHALLVGPNSGYGEDNSCLLDTIARNPDKFKGIAVVDNNTSLEKLHQLQQQGIIGVAFNVALHGIAQYTKTSALLEKLTTLDMYLQIQVQHDQLTELLPLLTTSKVKVLVDHCGRPDPKAGLNQQGFRDLLRLADSGRVFVKISGQYKISQAPYPYPDMTPYIKELFNAFTLDGCVWASDWPFLRAPARLDYAPLLKLIEHFLPSVSEQHKLLWQTPARLFGFATGERPAT
ncbi:amidohydrolase family protein [Pelobacter seleniigenes]|uniref:amidohydrolase family protein n=1 Tax=Pelobacter seleniigenes TaxID=407188 RepID=UPI0004A6F105|nr:amidohydrolase family protein [Pelobacter seleniigenes]